MRLNVKTKNAIYPLPYSKIQFVSYIPKRMEGQCAQSCAIEGFGGYPVMGALLMIWNVHGFMSSLVLYIITTK